MKAHSSRRASRPSSPTVPRPEVRFEGGVMTAYGGAGLLRTWGEKPALRERLAQVAG